MGKKSNKIIQVNNALNSRTIPYDYKKTEMIQYLNNVPHEYRVQIIHQPLEEKPYYLIGSSPFTSSLDLLEKVCKIDTKTHELFFVKDLHHTNIALHNHDFFELIYVSSGVIETIIDNDRIILEQGDICILNKTAIHSIRTQGNNNVTYNGIMKDMFRTKLLQFMPKNHPITYFIKNQTIAKNHLLFRTRDYEKVQRITINMIEDFYLDKPESNMAIWGHFMILMTELMRLYQYENSRFDNRSTDNDLAISHVIGYLQKHYQHANIADIATHFHFNPSYLSRLIKKETGKSFTELLQEIKLEKSAILLENSHRTIEEIAYEVGYSSISYFYKVFKKYYNMTPMEYKASHD